MKKSTNDKLIRTALKNALCSRFTTNHNTAFIEELGLKHGAARIDLAVINNHLHGYEVKSDIDTLRRLQHQTNIYNSIFDYITMVVGYRHAYEVINTLPEWWGIEIAERSSTKGITLLTVRKPRINPHSNIFFIVKLLWKQEAISLLDKFGLSSGFKSKSKETIYQELTSQIKPKILKTNIIQILKARPNALFDLQHM